MSDELRPSLLKRVPPGVWMALLWFAATASTVVQKLIQEERLAPWQDDSGQPLIERAFGHSYGNLTSVLLAAVLVLLTVPLRRRPLTALGLLLAATVLSTMGMSVMDIPLLQALAVDVAVCFIAATEVRRTSLRAAVMAVGVLVGYAVVRVALQMPITGASNVAIVALTSLIAWLIGNAIHENHAHAEVLRGQAAEQAVTAERLRIARELHDMVAHSIGVVAIQSGVAARVIETQPAEARKALFAIEATSRETLAGLRRMLVSLRRAEPEPETVALDPAPGLDDLERLAQTTAGAGVRVELAWLGERRPLPPEIELSAFRIVQEAVTNVVRHADAGWCRVLIGYGEGELSVEVVDDGRGGEAAAAGYGIVGMRERVGLLAGEFEAGPRAEGGFRVAARLPLPVAGR